MQVFMTLASDYITRKKKRFPPFYDDKKGVDRAIKLYQNLEPTLPQKVRDSITNANISIGEVGRTMPYVFNSKMQDGSTVIVFYSGQIDFVYAVARAFSGLGVTNTVSGPEGPRALSIKEVSKYVASLFTQYKSFRMLPWNIFRIRYPTFSIYESIHEWAEVIAAYAELFMLAHEIGHIVVEKKKGQFEDSWEERSADTIAMLLVSNYANIKGDDRTMIFAGAVFAIKLIEGLEKTGVKFPKEYPSAKDRIENISKCVLSECPSTQYFYEISRIAVAYEDMMDSVIDILKPRDQLIPDFERILVRLIAEILEVALGRIKKEKLIASLLEMTDKIPTDIKKQIVDTLYNYYVLRLNPDSFIDEETKMKMGSIVNEVCPIFETIS
jgi:hypothetical protein